ncbi:uncharacterized protein LOC131675381 [Phymastichus coffea]|uniref:uncharacterized protein LOC131675381 n=1 Tax=Phymastichus coffea TaxID=108790 RepID=UPI00273CC45B|nr:uncharacterized protein LOC131675381 [Phymastichus coffea]
MSDDDSGMSDLGDVVGYAAVRFYVDNAKVKFVPVQNIRCYDPSDKNFPYDAYVANGQDADGHKVYEPAVILDINDDKETLQARKTRWPKPNKRLSVVVHELANKERTTKSNTNSPVSKRKGRKKTFVVKSSNKGLPPSISEAKLSMNDRINALEENFSVDIHEELVSCKPKQVDKDKLIEELQKKLEELQKQC